MPWTAGTVAGETVTVKSPLVVTVKARRAVPRVVVTVRFPVVAPMGTVVVMVVAVIVRMTAATPFTAT